MARATGERDPSKRARSMVPSSMLTASSKAKRPGGLQGPRPEPLSVSAQPPRPSKKPRGEAAGGPSGPVIVYEHTPRVVHARPHEFMAVVQRLTGRRLPSDPAAAPAPVPPSSSPEEEEEEEEEGRTAPAADPLVLTLGQQRRHPALPLFDDRSAPSPAAGAASLVSPTSFLFSPTTMQAIQELTASLF